MASQEEAEIVLNSGKVAEAVQNTSMGSTFAFNVISSSSSKQLFSMIEGLQVVMHMPLFSMKSPGNVNAFNDILEKTIKFDPVESAELTNELGYIPEMDPISINFQNGGYENNLMIPNLGCLFYTLLGHIPLILVQICILLLAKKFVNFEWLNKKVANYLYFNGSMRIFIEAYMDLVLCALLNVKDLDWSHDFSMVTASNYLAITVLSLSCCIPILMVI